MAEHEHKCASPAQGPNISLTSFGSSGSGLSQSFHLGPRISFSGGLSVPPNLGSLTSVSPTTSLLSCSLSSLSLQDSKMAGSLPGPLGSLSNTWQASQPVNVAEVGKNPGVGGQGGSPSLAELIQAHQNNSPDLFNSVPDLQNLSSLTAANPQSNANTATTHHSGLCLNSLPLPNPPPHPLGFSATPSLSDLASQHQGLSPKLQNHTPLKNRQYKEQKSVQPKQSSPVCQPQSVDLSVLMAQTSPGPASPRHGSHSNRFTNQNIVAVFAKPSVFALSMCVQIQRKRRSQCSRAGHHAFLYSKQMARAKERVQGPPLHHITPFSFDTPSPDDIVKANQKKAFTRE